MAVVHDRRQVAPRVGIITFIGGLGGGLVFPILPALGLQLGISSFVIGIIVSANRVSRLAFDSPAGRVVDRLGGRIPLAGGMLIEALGIFFYDVGLQIGHVVAWLLVGRIIFGIGSALLMVGAQAVVLGASRHEDRGRSIAIVRIALSMGMPAGLVLGGLIADLASDSVAFLTGAGLTLAGAVVALVLIPPGRTVRPPSGGAKGGRSGLASVKGQALPARPVIIASAAFNAMIFLCVQGVLLATLVVLVHVRDMHLFGMHDQGTAGLVMAVMMACSSLLSFTLGRGIDRLPMRTTVVLPALIVLCAGFVLLALAQGLPMLFAGVILIGCSFNGVSLPMLALLGDVTDPDRYGHAVGVYQMFGDVGGSIGPMLGLVAGAQIGLLPTYFGLAALIGVSSLVALWRAGREKRALAVAAHG